MATHDISSDLLARYLAGEADEAQGRAVESWAAAAPENQRELDRMRRVWDLGGDASAIPELSVDAAWSRLAGRIADAEGRGRVRSIKAAPPWPRWLAAAAVVGGLVFAVQWFFQDPTQTHYASIEPTEILLADDSRTVLAVGSRIEERMGAERAITLQGSAYFEVRRDEERPFTVAAGDVLVTVLGTAFEVNAYDTSEFVDVRVRSGRVRVQAGEEAVDLAAGDHVRYHKQRHFLERRPAPPAEVWGIRILHFDAATLVQVAEQLERIYKVRIDLANERVATCRLTAEFDDEPIGTILDVIAETFSLRIVDRDGTYLLDGDGC
ncbi:MAG: FecR domain-containing protein [Flavobacteriales bacterium]